MKQEGEKVESKKDEYFQIEKPYHFKPSNS